MGSADPSNRASGLVRALCRAFASRDAIVPQAVAQLRRHAIGQPPVAQIPWAHNVLIMQRVKSPSDRLWYIKQTLANGWSRSVLTLMIESGAHARQGKAITNFDRLLPSPQSDLAQQTARNGRDSTAQGAALGNKCETSLAALKGRHSLCGAGRRVLSFTFCAGNGQLTSCRRTQESHPVGVPLFAWRITQGSAALRPGLWNYAASRLRPHRACLDGEADGELNRRPAPRPHPACLDGEADFCAPHHVATEINLIHHPGKPDGAFSFATVARFSKPSDSPIRTRRMGSRRLSTHAAARVLRHPTDSPTIGLILCQNRNRVVAEYALRGMTQPIGVSQYKLTRILPRELRSSLPSIDEIEAELAGPATEQGAAKRRAVKKKAKRKGAKS
jgi:hypothetical protein